MSPKKKKRSAKKGKKKKSSKKTAKTKKSSKKKKARKKSKKRSKKSKTKKSSKKKKSTKKGSKKKKSSKKKTKKSGKSSKSKRTKKKTIKKKSKKSSRKSTKKKKTGKKKKKSTKKKKTKSKKKSSKKKNAKKKSSKKGSKKPPKFTRKKRKRRKKVKHPVLPWTDNTRVDMVVKVLGQLMKKKVISDWRINFSYVKSANVYVGKRHRIEDQLAADREELVVTLYRRFDDGTIGEAQLPVITTTEVATRKELESAATICEHTRKKDYELPEPEQVDFPEGYDQVMLDTFTDGNGLSVPLELQKRIRQVMKNQDVKTNCYEILTQASATRVLNSNGIDVSYHQTAVYVEVTMTASDGKDEQEHHWWTKVVSPQQIDLQVVLERQAAITQDALAAEPSPGFTGDVLLSGRSLIDFFAPEHNVNPLVLHTFAKLKMMGISQLSHQEPLGEFEGEPFTITSDPDLPLGTLTVPVDEEGTPLEPVDLIKTGVFVNHIATSRYAQHLDLPHTGMVSNIRVADGATREEHLRGHDYVEIVSFSWFNPDPFSGDFSAEIRLGYRWENGKRTPFRGGHFTGNVFKNILHARFSREIMQESCYYGPRAVLFKDATVTKRG